MAEEEKTVQESYRLPAAQVAFIKRLAKLQILGATRSAVARTLLNNAIKELIETEFVRKHKETLKHLK